MRDLRWLTERPIAHRGLHGGAIVENTLAAADAAANAGYGIECDVQFSADGEVVVFHDDTLGRLTAGTGFIYEKALSSLREIPFRGSAERIPTLQEFLSLVAGRVPVVIELKSRWNGDTTLAEKTAAIVAGSKTRCAVMSFDPWLIRALRLAAPDLTRGIVAERYYNEPDWAGLSPAQKFGLGNLTHIPQTKPHFIAYGIRDLPAIAPLFARNILGMNLLTWTVRTDADRARARRWTDQMIFEGFLP
jgi:glycerophosphoryl diester phosphodiesterase